MYGGANFYWARCDGNSFRLIDLNAQPTNTVYNDSETAITLPRITYGELLYHTVIVFDASDAVKEESNNEVYDELNYMLSKIAYDVRYLTGYLPKINLIGHSRGGITNLQYALDHLKMVKALISVGTPYLGGKMLSSDSVLEMIGFIEADPANPGNYIVPGGIQDIRNEALQAHYRNRWNEGRLNSTLYDVNPHALGAYCELGFLKTIIDEGGDVFPEGFDKEGLKTIIDGWMFNDLVFKVGELLGQATPEQKEIIETLEKSVKLEIDSWWIIPTSFIYYVYDDIVVDLGSQLATGYIGFKQVSEEFSDISLFDKRTNWSQVPVLHNLETYSPWFVEYVKSHAFAGVMRSLVLFSINYSTGTLSLKQGANIPAYALQRELPQIVVIPSKFDRISVTAIATNAFQNQTACRQIVIPDSVTTVGSNAFLGCSNLTIMLQRKSVPIAWAAGWNCERPVTFTEPGGCGMNHNFAYILSGQKHKKQCAVCLDEITESHNLQYTAIYQSNWTTTQHTINCRYCSYSSTGLHTIIKNEIMCCKVSIALKYPIIY